MRTVMRILTIISGAVFAIALGVGFVPGYGFINTGLLLWEAMLWVLLLSGVSLLLSLIALLSRRVRKDGKDAISVVCVLLTLLAIFMLYFSFFEPVFGEDTSGNQYCVYTSPKGKNQIVVYVMPIGGERKMYAYPMVTRRIYKRVDNGFVWEAYQQEWKVYELENEYTVEWPSERQAIVTVSRENSETYEDENPDGRIIVDFE